MSLTQQAAPFGAACWFIENIEVSLCPVAG